MNAVMLGTDWWWAVGQPVCALVIPSAFRRMLVTILCGPLEPLWPSAPNARRSVAMIPSAPDAETAVVIVRGHLKGLACNVISITAEDQLIVRVTGIVGVYIQLDRGLVDELSFDD